LKRGRVGECNRESRPPSFDIQFVLMPRYWSPTGLPFNSQLAHTGP
jgi:hypothetical protein